MMEETERMQRLRDNSNTHTDETYTDEIFAGRILALLNHCGIDNHCMVDAYYYDFSAIPEHVQARLNLWQDCYLIFGITNKGDIISKWVDRWDLDSNDSIVDGKVIRSEKKLQ